MTAWCSTCKKVLLHYEDQPSPGTLAALIIAEGYIVKNPVLYGAKSEWLFFCSEEHKDKYYTERLKITPAKRQQVAGQLSKIRREIPAMTRRTLSEAIRFTEALPAVLTELKDRKIREWARMAGQNAEAHMDSRGFFHDPTYERYQRATTNPFGTIHTEEDDPQVSGFFSHG